MSAAQLTASAPLSTLATIALVVAIALAAGAGAGSSLLARVSPPDDVRIGSPVRLARAGDETRIGSPVRLASAEGTAARSPIRPVRTV